MLGVSAGVIRRDEVFAGGAVAGYIFKQIVDSAMRATKDEVSAAAEKSGSEPRLKVVT